MRQVKAVLLMAGAALGAGCASAAAAPDPQGEVAPATNAGLPELGPNEGIILTAEPGGTVEMRALESGKTLTLKDGARVRFQEEFAEVGAGRAEAHIVAEGEVGVVPNDAVVTEARLVRLPNGVALFKAVRTCEAYCQARLTLVDADGARIPITEDARDGKLLVAPNGTGGVIAIGREGLWVATLRTGKVKHWDDFTAPAYGPDGTLVVRGVGANDAVFEIGEFGQGVLIAQEPGVVPANEADGAFPDPERVAFEDGGKTIVAHFKRADGIKEQKIQR
ncbi:MAG: hypothetical protein KC635_09405 [Myxococcales bacterium]|nr:hypothetical protein [Myxococcales bacterium]MCB9732108.1 hypothetical protein [Deltaproteobacteria bacterium]